MWRAALAVWYQLRVFERRGTMHLETSEVLGGRRCLKDNAHLLHRLISALRSQKGWTGVEPAKLCLRRVSALGAAFFSPEWVLGRIPPPETRARALRPLRAYAHLLLPR